MTGETVGRILCQGVGNGGGVETPPFILFLENGSGKRRNNDRVEIMEKNKEL